MVSFFVVRTLNKMKLLKTVPAAMMLAGGMFASMNAAADNNVFTVMDDPSTAKHPFEGNVNGGYLAQSGNTKSSSLTADSTLTWYGNTTAWSLWGTASNTSSNDERSSEKYSVGGRTRYNLTDMNYLFGQASWLTDRYNGYHQRDVGTVGYGRQFLNGPVHSLRFEFGPGVRYDEYTDGDTNTQILGYASGAYAWQMTDTTKFTQGVSVFGSDDTTFNSETALEVAINDHFGLKVAYNLTWNSEPPASAPSHTDRRTSISLGYKM
ncbi:putative salt-induced outer membrane protein [Enterobacter sp. BIGb0383]|nr:putative salt-induced outer membrane protein [Enterobacter sp. BIGb0383]ROS12585.1 putative salt-induced outer membrane protein [Enterobacter sp. BIGb0359]